MANQISINLSLGYVAFFIGIGATLLCFRLLRNRVQTSAAEPDSEEAARPEKTEGAVAQLRDVAHNMACDVAAHRLLVESVSDRLGASLTGDTKDEKLILDATVELLDANLELQCRLADAEKKIETQEQEISYRQQEAETDPLTRLPNRRSFDAHLEQAVADLKSANQPYSVVMLDVDFFKQFNDAHGHVAGDEVLRRLGCKLPQIIKSTDVACRYGGEEFAVILRGARLLEAQAASQRIRQAIEAMTIEIDGSTLTITASFGVAEGVPGEEGRRVVARADECVYASKRAGRNCCHWHNGAQCIPASRLKPETAARNRGWRRRGLQPLPMEVSTGASAGHPVISDRAVLVSLLQRRVAESARSHESLSIVRLAVRQEAGRAQMLDAARLDSLVVAALATSLREMDYLGRWAAGEFMIILPRCTEPAARIVAQRMVAVIKSALPVSAAGDDGLALSFGVAEVIHPMTAEQVLEIVLRVRAGAEASS